MSAIRCKNGCVISRFKQEIVQVGLTAVECVEGIFPGDEISYQRFHKTPGAHQDFTSS